MPRSIRLTLQIATVAGLLPSLGVALAVFWPGSDLLSSRGYFLGQDFVNFWTAGHLALDGRTAEIYDRDAYDAVVKALFPPAWGFLNFSYPPHVLPLLSVLALLPYYAALVLWQVLGVASFLGVSLAGADRPKLRNILPYVVVSPIVILVATVGQASFFLAALFVGALRLLPGRPIPAGILLGFLTVKPQLGILLPPALLILGERRCFLAATAATFALVGLSIAVFGIAPWRDYLTDTLPFQQRVVTEMIGIYPIMMVTPYGELWSFGVPARVAFLLHGLAAAGVVAATVIVLRRPVAFALQIAVLALASVIVTPYCLNYDLAVPAAAILFWATHEATPPAPTTLVALGLFWFVPYIGMALVLWGLPATPVIVVALFLALVHEGRRSPRMSAWQVAGVSRH